MNVRSVFSLSDESNRIIRNTFNASTLAYVLSALASSIGSLIDGVVIGQLLGLDSMEAFGLVSPIVIVFALVGAVIASGARNRFTLMIGHGDLEGARGVFSLSVVLGVGSSVALMLAVIAFANPLCVLLGATGSAAGLLDKTRGYLMGLVIGLPAMSASRVLMNYMTIDNDRKLNVIASATLTVVDVVLDLVIALNGGDTFGMGLATSISHYAALAVLLTHFRRKERLTRFSFKSIRWHEAKRIFAKGMPNGVARISNTTRTIILNRILAATAAAGCIAAYSVHRQADSLLNPFIFGVSDTVVTLTGVLAGEENRPMLKKLTKDYLVLIWTFVLGVSVLFWFVSPLFASFFIKIKDDPEALQYAVRAARSYAAGMPLYGMNIAYASYMEGRGKANISMLVNFLSEGAYLVLMAAAFLPVFGPDAVWYAFPAAQFLLTLTLAGICAYENRKEKTCPADTLEWMLALPNDFDVPDEDRIDRTITSHDEVIALSRAAWTFCDEHGCDEDRKYAIALVVEELATNTVMSGFRPGRRNTIDMRILKKGNEYIVRLRDDCMIFDPVKQLQLYDNDSPTHHFGLRLALGSAKDVQYTTILKLNNLVLRV